MRMNIQMFADENNRDYLFKWYLNVKWYLNGEEKCSEHHSLFSSTLTLVSNENGVITLKTGSSLDETNISYDYGVEIKHVVISGTNVYALTSMEGSWLLNESLSYGNSDITYTVNNISSYFPLCDDENTFTLENIIKVEISPTYSHFRVYSDSYTMDLGTQTSYNTLGSSTFSSYVEIEIGSSSNFYPGIETKGGTLSSENGIKVRTLTFDSTYSCSDEFAVWLSNNATKVEEEKQTKLTHYYRNSKLISVDGKSCKFRHYSAIQPVETDEFVGTWVLNKSLNFQFIDVDSQFINIQVYSYLDVEVNGSYINLIPVYGVDIDSSYFTIYTGTSYNSNDYIKMYYDSANKTFSLKCDEDNNRIVNGYVGAFDGKNYINEYIYNSEDGILLRTIVVSENYSCSDTFKSWLMANATKQEDGGD